MSDNNFKCERCGYDFTTKQSLILHLKRKNKCTPFDNDINVATLLDKLIPKETINSVYTCIHCKKQYTNRISKYQHQSKCKIKLNENNTDNENTNIIPISDSDKIKYLENELKLKKLEIELLKKDSQIAYKDLEINKMKADLENSNLRKQIEDYKLLLNKNN